MDLKAEDGEGKMSIKRQRKKKRRREENKLNATERGSKGIRIINIGVKKQGEKEKSYV